MNMAKLMNQMILEASKTASVAGLVPGYASRATEKGEVDLFMTPVNTNGRQMIQKRWELDGKRISAAKLAAL